MLKVTVLYPKKPRAKFDWDYYMNSHIKMVKKKLGKAVKKIEVDVGLGGEGPPGTPAPFIAVCTFWFANGGVLEKSFVPHVPTFQADVKNYTNIVPTVLISEVK